MLLYGLNFEVDLKNEEIRWKDSRFVFNSSNLEESLFNVLDVFYMIKLCSYENEQSEQFRLQITNNRVFNKQQQVK